MYKRILISTDGSETAQRGVDHGLQLARSLNVSVTILTVTEPFLYTVGVVGPGWVPLQSDIDAYEEGQKAQATQILDGAKKAAEQLGLKVDVVHSADAGPAEAIIETAQEKGCDLIVMASHGRRGFGRLLLGSQTSEVLTHSKIPVLVVR